MEPASGGGPEFAWAPPKGNVFLPPSSGGGGEGARTRVIESMMAFAELLSSDAGPFEATVFFLAGVVGFLLFLVASDDKPTSLLRKQIH